MENSHTSTLRDRIKDDQARNAAAERFDAIRNAGQRGASSYEQGLSVQDSGQFTVSFSEVDDLEGDQAFTLDDNFTDEDEEVEEGHQEEQVSQEDQVVLEEPQDLAIQNPQASQEQAPEEDEGDGEVYYNFSEEDFDEESAPVQEMVFDEDEGDPRFLISDDEVEDVLSRHGGFAAPTDDEVEFILSEKPAVEILDAEPVKPPISFGGSQGDYARYAVNEARKAARIASEIKKLDGAMEAEAKRIRFLNESSGDPDAAANAGNGVRLDL